MASMALNTIGKLILILVVIGVVFGLFQTLFPKAADAFFNKTKLNIPVITLLEKTRQNLNLRFPQR